MKKEYAKRLTNAALMLIACLIVVPSGLRQAHARFNVDEPVCGNIEKFTQTHRWEDLPGCTEGKDYSNPTSAAMLMSRAKSSCGEFFELWKKGDLDHIKSNATGCSSFLFGAERYWSSDPELVRAKPAFDEMSRRVEQYLGWLPLVENLAQRYFYAMTFLEEAGKKGDLTTADVAQGTVKNLKTALAEAQQQNVPEDFIVPGIGTVRAATIGDIKLKLDSYVKQAANSMTDAVNADNAKWEPFTKLLSGDRLRFFNQTYRGGSNVFGRGGQYLDTPAEFASAPVMCTRTWGHSGIFETWRVDCYSFRGDRRISGPRSQSGLGTNTPSSAYR